MSPMWTEGPECGGMEEISPTSGILVDRDLKDSTTSASLEGDHATLMILLLFQTCNGQSSLSAYCNLAYCIQETKPLGTSVSTFPEEIN